ncbi:MAG: hypothetical protein RL297_2304 [Pseudomonadota bacterium]|jgi:hypothetical protein
MVLAFVKIMIEAKLNPMHRLWVQAQDIDRTAALMCYIQLSLWGVPAAVVVGNTLANEQREVFLHHWPPHGRVEMEARTARRRTRPTRAGKARGHHG